jgi:teichoic acid transport system ATP-binding protein
MDELAIRAENLGKIYHLYEKPIDRLKEALTFRKYYKTFHALQDISFEVKSGETVGILGKNGSGKSTLLKIITGILRPTNGHVSVQGRIAALLELGAGFNPEYTGIENVYLNGTIMGYSKEEMTKRLPQIIQFADIGDFINQPVKNYSSGMFARLAFAVAINVDPDILIIDETLSVGDLFFQNKCYKKFEELQKKGVTILFVSHDVSSIKKYCNRVLWISEGRQVDFGDKDEICVKYYNQEINDRNANNQLSSENEKNIEYGTLTVRSKQELEFPQFIYKFEVGGSREAEILSFRIKDSLGQETSFLEAGQTYSVHILGGFSKPFSDVLFGITMETAQGFMVLSVNNFIDNYVLKEVDPDKIYECIFIVQLPKLLRGRYLISPAIATGTQQHHTILCWYQNAVEIFIENDGYNLSLIELESEWIITEYDEKEVKFVGI